MTLPVFIRSSGTHGVWLWKSRWHLSTLYRTGLLHSHTFGKSPAHENPSCVVWYRLPPDGALVCRFWSRSGEHNKTHQCSRMTAGRGLLRVLLYEASWSVAFLDSATPGHGWNSDHGCDPYAECHPELGYVGSGCSQWLGCRCHYCSGYQGNTSHLYGIASFSSDRPCRLKILGGDYGSIFQLHIPYHCCKGRPAPGFCPSYCRRKPVLDSCPQIDWQPEQESPLLERTWWSWVWPASCLAVNSPPSAPRPVGEGSEMNPWPASARPSPGEGFPELGGALKDGNARRVRTPRLSPSRWGSWAPHRHSSPNPSWIRHSALLRTRSQVSSLEQARPQWDPLLWRAGSSAVPGSNQRPDAFSPRRRDPRCC